MFNSLLAKKTKLAFGFGLVGLFRHIREPGLVLVLSWKSCPSGSPGPQSRHSRIDDLELHPD